MSENEEQIQQTQHAFMVAWGEFAQEKGLTKRIEGVKLRQKNYFHAPQTKVLEFLVAIMGGLKQLQEISLAAHPLDKDQAVAEAWGQSCWADYSGVSRTMSSLNWEEARAIVKALEEFSQPFLEAELEILRAKRKRLMLDGDLTGIPVSNTSTTYPNAAYGHMDDDIQLGYQAGVVSWVTETYGRLWLSGTHHPGDTVSSTQAESLVLAAEERLGLHPLRRTDLLGKRIEHDTQNLEPIEKKLKVQQEKVEKSKKRLQEAQEQAIEKSKEVERMELMYQACKRPERPTSRLALQRKQSQAAQRRIERRKRDFETAQRKFTDTHNHLDRLRNELTILHQRLERFLRENLNNQSPIEAEFRLDAGFGAYDNIALLVEMGYEVYTKPYGDKVTQFLRNKVQENDTWTRVGSNAEMIAWANLQLKGCPYPLDMAIERFYTGKTLKYGALCHFGTDPVTQDLPAWFIHYNGRQIVEAGIKEGKQVFYLHRIKVRSEPAIFLQERMTLFAANFIRWAAAWISEQTQSQENALDVRKLGVKRQVQVGAHVSAQVIRNSDGMLLRFSEHSAFAGKVLKFQSSGFPPHKRQKF